MRPRKIKIGITDDHTLFREGMAGLLDHHENISVVLKACNGLDLIRKLKVKKNIPHILLLDLQMPEMDGIKTTKYLIAKFPSIRIIILSMHNTDNMVINLMENGASGFLPKDADITMVMNAIYSVNKNDYYMSERVAKILNNSAQGKRENIPDLDLKLSERESHVLKLICEQMNTREIAIALGLSARTIESHKTSILKKTNTRNTAGLAIYALTNNLIDNFIFREYK